MPSLVDLASQRGVLYTKTARELRRLDSVTKSPLFSLVRFSPLFGVLRLTRCSVQREHRAQRAGTHRRCLNGPHRVASPCCEHSALLSVAWLTCYFVRRRTWPSTIISGCVRADRSG
jgi:hypothetical protein